MPVAEIFISALVTVLIEKLASSLLSKFARLNQIQTQLKKWSTTFKTIQAVLNDAEEKQITNKDVQVWLDDLQDLAYDLDDILDDLMTEALRRESVKAHHEASTSKVRRLIPTCCTSFTSTPTAFLFDYNMGSKLEDITKRLQDLSNRKNNLGLIANVGGITSYRTGERETSSVVNESHVYGRENDKKEVIKLLLRDETRVDEVSVIPIVGMGGVGKTTLAQLVFNDDEVKGWFDLMIWVCVSDEFDVFEITKRILEDMASNLNDAQVKLKQKLSNRKFLLVLDDIWNEDYGKWDQLRTPFLVGAPGSIVIVTTRNEKVASMMGNVPIYHLSKLLDDDCLSILARHALQTTDFDGHPKFKIVGEELVKKCKGLPLAAKAIGGLLRTKRTAVEWEEILNSKIWKFPEQSSGILPALRLSYHHLPPRLKRMFSYCSIFPTDYEFDKYELILLWMAEGFLQQSEGKKRMEEMGFQDFNELVSRSFFQPLSCGDKSLFVMHDMMNDLAQFVAKGICYRVEDGMKSNEQYGQFGKARHSSFVRQEYDVFTKFEDYYRVRGLRTFLPLPVHKVRYWKPFYLSSKVVNELLPKLRCLRVLSLSGYSIIELPNSIGELKHLRYLNLSQTLITHLPESVSDLYNLQILSLRYCSRLCKLPTRIGNLVNLRHLDIGDTTKLLEMPPGIGNLTSLQTLSKIILDKNNMLKVTELRGLSDLRGTLAIIGLHNVMNVQDARQANLLCKPSLEDLTLSWSSNFDDSRRTETLEYEVLEVLKPDTNLTKLEIVFYGGTEFPSWVCDPSFVHITTLTLGGCKKFASLPSLGHLPSLKELFIEGMAGVKNVGHELHGVGYPRGVVFQSLETLKFENMVGWEEWSFNLTETNEHVSAFPRLHNLIISNCPALVMISLPSLLSLQVLNIRKCDEVVLRGIVSVASLTTIEMDQIIGLSKLHERVVRSLGELRLLKIKNCDELRYLWEEEESSCHNLVNLVDLSFDNCCKLEKLPDLENCLTSLKKLDIRRCPRLQSFQTTTKLPTKEKELIESNSNNHNESSSRLERLSIWGCESLTCFLPSRNLPTALQCLQIYNCSNLEPDSDNFWLLNSSMSSLQTIIIDDWVKLTSLPRCLLNLFHLTRLELIGCPGIESFPERGFPPNLRALRIIECENLKSLPDDQMQSLTSLLNLIILNCPCLESYLQGRWPPNLETLLIGDMKQPISEWGLHRLPTSLVDFSIYGPFPGLVSFLDVGSRLPTSLKELSMHDLVSIESLSMGLQNLTSLQTLIISKCPKLQSLPDLTSLQTLDIHRCPELQSLPDLTSLRILEIHSCPKLQSLPDTLLPTLSSLDINNCPLLEERCLKEKRDYWPRISHIPFVKIDSQLN